MPMASNVLLDQPSSRSQHHHHHHHHHRHQRVNIVTLAMLSATSSINQHQDDKGKRNTQK
eukprot:6455184-Amphidinium_carterae.2